MAKSYEIAFKVGASMAGNFAKVMGSASGALSEMNNKIADIGRNQKATQQLIKLREQVAHSSREYIQAKTKVAELGKAIANAEKPTKAMRAEFAQAERAVSRAKEKLEGQRATLKALNTEMGTTGKRTADLVKEQSKLAQTAERAAKTQQALQRNVAAQNANKAKRGELRGQLFDAVGLAATLAAPVKLAADWEQSLAEFNKVADVSDERLKAYSQAAQEAAVSTGVAREEIMGAYISAAQAGFATDEWDKFAMVSAKMGIAFDTTGENAGEMLKAWRSSMALTMDDAEKLAAAANHLANNMNATAVDVGEVLQRQGAVLKSAGLSDVQGAALAGAFLSGGATAEVAATASKNFVIALTKGSAATKAEAAALEALGFHDPQRLAQAMQKAPEEAIMMVLKRIQKIDAAEQTALISQLFGKETIGAVAPLVGNLEVLSNAFALVNDESKYLSSLEDEFNAMGSTTTNQLRKATESMKMMATTIGAVLLPPINQLFAAVAPVIANIATWAGENEKLTTVIVATVAALMAAKIAAIAGGYAFTFVKGAVLAVRGAMLAARAAYLLFNGSAIAGAVATKAAAIGAGLMTAAQWLLNTAMMAFPGVWIMAAIVGVIAAGVLLYKNWDTVKEYLGKAWEFIKNAFMKGFEIVKNLFLTFHPLGWMIGGIQPLLDFLNQWGLVDLFMEKFNAVKDWLMSFSLFESGVKILSTMAEGIKSAVSGPVDAIKGVLTKVRDFLPFSDAKVGPLSQLTASGQSIMTTLARGMMNFKPSDIGSAFTQFGEGVKGGLAGFANGIAGGGAGNTVTVNLTQNITVAGGGAVSAEVQAGARAGGAELVEEIERALAREQRLSYG